MKKLDEGAMRTELSASVFFRKPESPTPEPRHEKASQRMFSKLMEVTNEDRNEPKKQILPSPSLQADELELEEIDRPYEAQTYRFTPDEMAWIREQSYLLSKTLGFAVYQNTILRIGLLELRRRSHSGPERNPLLDELRKDKK